MEGDGGLCGNRNSVQLIRNLAIFDMLFLIDDTGIIG
jgi:hypothetical protein